MQLDYFGRGARFHHIGMGVPSIRDVSPTIPMQYDPLQGVHVAFVTLNGLPMELIEPVGDSSPVAASLKKGFKLLHVCYEVDNLQEAVREGRRHGFHVVKPAAPAMAFGRQPITFVFSRVWGLVELLERRRQDAVNDPTGGLDDG